jgi:hypothetical protein
MTPYDDDAYLEWCSQLQGLVSQFLNTEGNTADSLREEVDNAIENVEVEDDE